MTWTTEQDLVMLDIEDLKEQFEFFVDLCKRSQHPEAIEILRHIKEQLHQKEMRNAELERDLLRGELR